ncbi:hypothetical protein KP509_30G003500 [Ceratopteris richardii]|uniref:Protein kinase domain-containing protein n=1 Tax=Ceratopteris richardii TaxID=49495 RepID=A0A8T2QZM7_CERRI|nr:hypothetical protein KP509_30G003500 [Ceratopteris richardii]
MGYDQKELHRTSNSILRVLFNSRKLPVDSNQLVGIFIDVDDVRLTGSIIGEGSSGIVLQGSYKGIHKVAVKELKDAFVDGSKTQDEFRREVLSLLSCVHENVIKLYGVCISPSNEIWIVTKLMKGGSLLDYLSKKRCLPVTEIIKISLDVAKGMQSLHSKGILHMDLKTANVFLDKKNNAVIGDLGTARNSGEKDEENSEIGTYRYMSPEVCARAILGSGQEGWFTSKSDVYSFGILLWELTTCKIPYSDYDPVQAAMGVMMHGLRPSIPASTFPPLRYLMQKCWHQNASSRPEFPQIVRMLQGMSHTAAKLQKVVANISELPLNDISSKLSELHLNGDSRVYS